MSPVANRLLWGLAAALLPIAAQAAPRGYPGAAWGNVSRDFEGLEGSGAMGWLRQGVEWTRLPGDIPLQTPVSYHWRLRTRNRPFFNTHGPSLGLGVSKSAFDLGVQFGWQRFPELGRTTEDFIAYLGCYKTWDLASLGGPRSVLGIPVLGFPFGVWGKLTHDINDVEGSGSMGWVSQGVEWADLPGGIVFKTLGAYRWRFRTENTRFYDTHGPALGVEFTRKPFDLGVEYAWRTFPGLRQTTRGFQLYASWYFGWDLKRKQRSALYEFRNRGLPYFAKSRP